MASALTEAGARPLLLDAFCGAGGAAMGYYRAGFDVIGVDINPQPRYPFHFIQWDALEFLEGVRFGQYDLIHASPPCQAHTSLKAMWNAKEHADLIEPVRRRLEEIGTPYVIENVPGAPLRGAFTLCGTMFGLGVADAELRRHRLFEISEPVLVPQCRHGQRGRRTIGVHGEGCRDSRRKFDKTIPEFTVKDGRIAMGIDWMTLAELCQAIPPAFTSWIGAQMLPRVRATA